MGLAVILGLPLRLYRRGDLFARGIISELQKVVWPIRREALYLTTVVVIVSVAVGIILGLLDYVFTKLTDVLVFR